MAGAFQGDLNRRRRAVRLIAMDRHQAAAGASNRGSVPTMFGVRSCSTILAADGLSPLSKLPVNHHRPLSILAVSLDGCNRL